MMKLCPFWGKFLKIALCTIFLGTYACSSGDSITKEIEPSSAEKIKQYWFNGAEITRYALVQSRYGEEHPGSAELIFVTEPFLTEKQVKHEGGPGPATPVLKMNALRSFNTGLYDYRTMLSVFSPTDTQQWPHALKTTTSVQDWCGQVFQQLNHRDGQWQGKQFSYFQSEGDQTFTLEASWLEDELWTRLRLDPQSLPTGNIKIVPSSLFLRFKHLPHAVHTANAQLDIQGNNATYTLTYPTLGRILAIEFEKAFPYTIQGWVETQTGNPAVTTATLTHRIENSYYWSLNKPKDAKLRKKLGLKK